MNEALRSPQEVADLLDLHVGTVRRYIREGRLDAVRIGNRYRVPSSALSELTGDPAPPAGGSRRTEVDVTGVVDLRPIDRDQADRLITLVMGAATGHRGEDGRLRVEVDHDPTAARMKIVVIGSLAQVSAALALVTTFTEQ